MEIIWKKRVTTTENGTFDLQLEDWSRDFPGTYPYGNTMAAYPISKTNAGGTFVGPRRGKIFRFAFVFPNNEMALSAAEAVAYTGAELSWYSDYLDRKDYLPCLTGSVND